MMIIENICVQKGSDSQWFLLSSQVKSDKV